MQYLYEIAGVRVFCTMPFSLHIGVESKEFLSPVSGKAVCRDLDFVLEPVDQISFDPSQGFWVIDRCYQHHPTGSEVFFCPHRTKPPYAVVERRAAAPKEVHCRYLHGQEFQLEYSLSFTDLLGLETLLLQHQALLLHSAFIRWRGQGILFSAPSGTGKSTQADLWERYEGAETINGDRAALRFGGNGWTAWGLPYAGSSAIYRNESAPVRAVVMLAQAKENRLRRLTAPEALRLLYPQLTIHHWEASFLNGAMDLAIRLTADVPVYLLECLPDRGAVELLKSTLLAAEGRPFNDSDSG